MALKMGDIINNIPSDVREDMGIPSPVRMEQQVVTQDQIPSPFMTENQQVIAQEEIPSPFISETFSKLESGEVSVNTNEILPIPVENEEKVQEVKKSTSPLDNIHIDINTIEIVEKSPFKQMDDFETVFKSKAVYQVVAVQSGYSGELSALTMHDINTITNSNVDLYNHKKNVYQSVHNHLESTSVGKIGFTDWLKVTSYHDFETLLYGIYCQTFPEKNEFDVTCGSCGKKTHIIVNNETLVETHNEGIIMAKIHEILNSCTKPEDLIGKSLVHTTIRTILPDSKMVLDIHTPSLFDHLEMLRTIDQKIVQQHAETIGVMLFIKDLFMIDVEATLQTGRPKYYPIKDKNTILDTLSKLSLNDGKHLEKTINERIEKYAISYSVKNSKCQHCSDSLGVLPVDIETALFTQIGKVRQG